MEWNMAKSLMQELLNSAEITLNGDKPWDIRVHNEKFYSRVLGEGTLGLGESYLDQWWDCQALDQFFDRIIKADLKKKIKINHRLMLKFLLSRLFNMQSKKRAFQVGERHYDIGNDLFKHMLDSRMVYTSAFWQNAESLDEAQTNKLNLTCQKLGLKPGMRLLDIGCGWGSLAKYAAENFGVEVVGITISKEQVEQAKINCHGLPVEIRYQDYRDLNDKFDRIVSLGMFEHVGDANYRNYMKIVQQNLGPDGLFLLHTIGNNLTVLTPDEWITKYIFPNGEIPSIKQIAKATENIFIMEDWHNFGADYDKTLMAWYANFNRHWDKLKTKYDTRFHRMWNYYLLSCAGAFRSRSMQLWQIVFSKEGVKGGYSVTRPYFQVAKESLCSAKNPYNTLLTPDHLAPPL